jgi:hypothetical protein
LAEHDLSYPFKEKEEDEEPDYWEGDDFLSGNQNDELPW